jgi:hypothetical protein
MSQDRVWYRLFLVFPESTTAVAIKELAAWCKSGMQAATGSGKLGSESHQHCVGVSFYLAC